MNEIKPRYEFRAFTQNLGIVEEKMRRLSPITQYRESLEIYIMSPANDENNTKIRNELMDIKVLVNREQGLEQWRPRMKGKFPMAAEAIAEQMFPAFGVATPALQRDAYTCRQYLEEIIGPHPELSAVNVYKQRYGYEIQGCTAEIAEVYINGARIRTACLESEDRNAVLAAMEDIRLSEFDNVNYLLAIKRVIGMAPLPEGVFYRAL